jgi:hypothetical protein
MWCHFLHVIEIMLSTMTTPAHAHYSKAAKIFIQQNNTKVVPWPAHSPKPD